jgi:TIR domain
MNDTASTEFDVFLSHNSRNKDSVRKLAEHLRGRGLKVWFDEWELIPGRPWREALELIAKSVRVAVVLVANDGIGPWQDRETSACLSEFVERNMPVIPVLLPGAPQKVELPLFLKQFTCVDLRDGLRDEGIDRLVWGITGKKPIDGNRIQVWNPDVDAVAQRLRRAGTLSFEEYLRVLAQYCQDHPYVSLGLNSPDLNKVYTPLLFKRELPPDLQPNAKESSSNSLAIADVLASDDKMPPHRLIVGECAITG